VHKNYEEFTTSWYNFFKNYSPEKKASHRTKSVLLYMQANSITRLVKKKDTVLVANV